LTVQQLHNVHTITLSSLPFYFPSEVGRIIFFNSYVPQGGDS